MEHLSREVQRWVCKWRGFWDRDSVEVVGRVSWPPKRVEGEERSPLGQGLRNMPFKDQKEKEVTRRTPKETGRVVSEEGGSRAGRPLGWELRTPVAGQCSLPTLLDPRVGRRRRAGAGQLAPSCLPFGIALTKPDTTGPSLFLLPDLPLLYFHFYFSRDLIFLSYGGNRMYFTDMCSVANFAGCMFPRVTENTPFRIRALLFICERGNTLPLSRLDSFISFACTGKSWTTDILGDACSGVQFVEKKCLELHRQTRFCSARARVLHRGLAH